VDRAREEVKGAQRQASASAALLEKERKAHRVQGDRNRDDLARLKDQLRLATKAAKVQPRKAVAAATTGSRGRKRSVSG